MSQPPAPIVLWQGTIEGLTYRVVDRGAGSAERLVVEHQLAADAMGGRGWTRFEPIPRSVFEGMLISSGVVQ